MNTKLIISCLAGSALWVSGCTLQTNKPPVGNGTTGPVSAGNDGGSPYVRDGSGKLVNGSGTGQAAGNNANGSDRTNAAGSSRGTNASNANNTGQNNAGQQQNQGGFSNGSAFGGQTEGVYTPSDLRNPNSLLAQRIIYFDYNQAGFRPEFREVLDAHSALLVNFPELRIRLEGHADERGSREYNVALSERRAYSVRDYLNIKGVRSDQIDIVGYGEEVPATFGHGESSWSKNRRVEIIYAGE